MRNGEGGGELLYMEKRWITSYANCSQEHIIRNTYCSGVVESRARTDASHLYVVDETIGGCNRNFCCCELARRGSEPVNLVWDFFITFKLAQQQLNHVR